jgi:hypothetical protein
MSVEIKELVIRAVVSPHEARPAPAGASAPAGEERAAVVEAAVREVLRILRTKQER